MLTIVRTILIFSLIPLLSACVYYPHHLAGGGYGGAYYDRGYDGNHHGGHHRGHHRRGSHGYHDRKYH